MIDKGALQTFVESHLADTPMFLVDLKISADNRIEVIVDSFDPVSVDDCVALTRAIEAAFNRDDEDYELEVGSAGLTEPFKVKAQYEKNLGNPVEVLTKDGRKLRGELSEVGDSGIVLSREQKVKRPGEKRPVIETVTDTIPFDNVKYTKYLLEF